MSLSLQFAQRKSLDARRGSTEGHRAGEIGKPFASDELEFRVAYMRDAGLEERRAWLAKVLPETGPAFRWSEFDSFIFSARQSDFNVAIIHGFDVRRLIGAFELNRGLLRNRTTIAVLNDSAPARRASLLFAGFDDVFDMRMAEQEARARIRRHVIRHTAARNQSVLDTLGIDSWPHAVSPVLSPQIERVAASFTPRERLLFGAMFTAIGRPVQYSLLLEICEGRELKDAFKSLRVAMACLRPKLKGLFTITAQTHVGYQLCLNEGVRPRRVEERLVISDRSDAGLEQEQRAFGVKAS